jgi:hypothetical protein
MGIECQGTRVARPNREVAAMKSPADLRVYLVGLRSKRRQGKRNSVRRPRSSLTAAERRQVLAKTSGRCHICGGKVEDEGWQADQSMVVGPEGGDLPDTIAAAITVLSLAIEASTEMFAIQEFRGELRDITDRWQSLGLPHDFKPP